MTMCSQCQQAPATGEFRVAIRLSPGYVARSLEQLCGACEDAIRERDDVQAIESTEDDEARAENAMWESRISEARGQ